MAFSATAQNTHEPLVLELSIMEPYTHISRWFPDTLTTVTLELSVTIMPTLLSSPSPTVPTTILTPGHTAIITVNIIPAVTTIAVIVTTVSILDIIVTITIIVISPPSPPSPISLPSSSISPPHNHHHCHYHHQHHHYITNIIIHKMMRFLSVAHQQNYLESSSNSLL